MIIASQLMTKSPSVIDVTSTLRSAIERLEALDIRHLPVVDSNGAVVGMLSDRDVRAVGNTALDASVATVMANDVIAVDLDTDVIDIARVMLDYKIGAVPVVDADDSIVGIISYLDLLRAFTA